MEKKTELKTLKDISYWMKEPPHNSDDTKIVFEKELRQEAIKWINWFKEQQIEYQHNAVFLEKLGENNVDIQKKITCFKCFRNFIR